MSRTMLAALRKNRTPAEFVRRFLLPVYKRGQVPRLPALKEGLGKLPEPAQPAGPIIFVNQSNPREEFHLRVERIDSSSFKSRPNVMIFKRQEKGAKVHPQDWSEGLQYARTRRTGNYQEVEFDKAHISPEWEKARLPRERGLPLYPIPEPLFREIQRYGTAAQATNGIRILIQVASRSMTHEQAIRAMPFTVRRGGNFFDQLAKAIPITRNGLSKILSTDKPEEVARVLQEELGIAPRYALRLASNVVERKNHRMNRFGLNYLIGHFGRL